MKAKPSSKKATVVIGRFQPFHRGHEALIRRAMQNADVTVVVIGSAACAPTVRNPWRVHDRVAMLSALFDDDVQDGGRIVWESVLDHPYDDNAWLKELKLKLSRHLNRTDHVTLVGHDKDESTYYLKLFPEWNFLDAGEQEGGVDGTTIRRALFADSEIPEPLPPGVKNYLAKNWLGSDEHKRLIREFRYIEKEQERSAKLKHAPVQVTVDAVITRPGKVLTIKRKNTDLGAGLRALPGSFVRAEETLTQAAVRSAFEKAGMIVKADWIRAQRYFDDPKRSLAGRRLTHVFRFDVPDHWEIKQTKGEWIDVADTALYAEEFFEDHGPIIEEMLGL